MSISSAQHHYQNTKDRPLDVKKSTISFWHGQNRIHTGQLCISRWSNSVTANTLHRKDAARRKSIIPFISVVWQLKELPRVFDFFKAILCWNQQSVRRTTTSVSV